MSNPLLLGNENCHKALESIMWKLPINFQWLNAISFHWGWSSHCSCILKTEGTWLLRLLSPAWEKQKAHVWAQPYPPTPLQFLCWRLQCAQHNEGMSLPTKATTKPLSPSPNTEVMPNRWLQTWICSYHPNTHSSPQPLLQPTLQCQTLKGFSRDMHDRLKTMHFNPKMLSVTHQPPLSITSLFHAKTVPRKVRQDVAFLWSIQVQFAASKIVITIITQKVTQLTFDRFWYLTLRERNSMELQTGQECCWMK